MGDNREPVYDMIILLWSTSSCLAGPCALEYRNVNSPPTHAIYIQKEAIRDTCVLILLMLTVSTMLYESTTYHLVFVHLYNSFAYSKT